MIARKLATFTVAALALAAAPAFASPDGQTRRVRYADLDLASPAGIAALRHRVDAAVDMVCGSYSNATNLDEEHEIDKCRNETRRVADQQVAALLSMNSRLASRR